MAKRLIIDCNASSPMRVSVAGVDADAAEFNNLIFDANQPPLRLWGRGWLQPVGLSYNEVAGGANTKESSPVSAPPSPLGTTPIFMCAIIVNGSSGVTLPSPPYRSNVGTAGGGGSIVRSGSANYFIALTFGSVGPPSFPDNPGPGALVNYAMFSNWT